MATASATPTASNGKAKSKSGYVPAQARLTSHYSINRAFFDDEEAIFSRIDEIRHIPCFAVHGGNDLVCPPSTAYELHAAWPEMRLTVVPSAGHSMYDPGLMNEVLAATDAMREAPLQLTLPSDTSSSSEAPPAPQPEPAPG